MDRVEMELEVLRNMRAKDEHDDRSVPRSGRGHGDSQAGHTKPGDGLKTFALFAGGTLIMVLVAVLMVFGLLHLNPSVPPVPRFNSPPPQASPLTATVRERIVTKEGDVICTSRECMRAGLTVLDKMDSSVDPCDDFYSYACGGFVQDTKIPDDKHSVHTYSIAGDLLDEQLISVLSEEIDDLEPTPFQYAKNLYQMCMDTARIELQGISPLLNVWKTVGGWPVLMGNNWNSDNSWSWVQLMKELRMLGYSTDYFFDVSVEMDKKNTTRRLIYVNQAALNVSREHLVPTQSNPTVEAYYRNMVSIALSLGATEDRAGKELQDSLDFERKLARISVPIPKQRNATGRYNSMTVKEFQSKYPYTDWVDYLNAMLNGTDIVIDENETIIVRYPKYMEKLGSVLQNTTDRTLANYAMWRIVSFSSPFLTKTLQGQQQQCSTEFSRKQDQNHRSKECLKVIMNRMTTAVGALHMRKYFTHNARRVALDMVNKIKREFVGNLKNVSWMDGITKQSALEKMDSMAFHVGYPLELLDDKAIIEYYKDLEYNPDDSYLDTVLNVDRFKTTTLMKKLRQPARKPVWTGHSRPSIFNSRYDPVENSIQVTAGVLQGQLFSYRLPNYMNYGSIGPIVGREITHGFDDRGRQFDKDGYFTDWWQTATHKAYQEKADCFVKQYGNYKDPDVEMTLNGVNTLIQNIADNSGLKQAYRAYKKWAKKNGPEPRLVGLDQTPEQMFWLSAAQTWCTVFRPEVLEKRIAISNLSPSRFRVLGPMSNMEEFSEDFKCPAGSPMNTTTKCQLW